MKIKYIYVIYFTNYKEFSYTKTDIYILEVTKMILSFGERKIQKTGYSFLCPLPATWAKNAKLDQSSRVNIEMLEDNSLRITPVLTTRQDEKGTGAPIIA